MAASIVQPAWVVIVGVLALVACSQQVAEEAAESSKKTGSGETVVEGELAVPLFMHHRLEVLVHDRLPKVLEDKDDGEARKLCEIGRRRVGMLQSYDDYDGAKAAIDAFKTTCAEDVVGFVLDMYIERVRNTDDDQRPNTCQMGSTVMAFVHTHRSDSDAIKAKRESVFELCPTLGEEWKMVEEGTPPPP